MAKFGDETKNKAPGPAVQEQVRRLSRIAGQVNGIARMVVEGRSPVDILTQLKAVRSALDVVEERLLLRALSEGIHKALELQDKGAQAKALEELFGLHSHRVAGQRALVSQPLGGSLDNF